VHPSISGSYVLRIRGKEPSLAYTGDFRMHGPRRDMTEEFVRLCEEERPDLFITEGTNFAEASSLSEEEVLNRAAEVARSTEGLLMVATSPRDVDRLRTYFQIASLESKKVILPCKLFLMLNWLMDRDPVLSSSLKEVGNAEISVYVKTKTEEKLLDQEFPSISVISDLKLMSRGELEESVLFSFEDFVHDLSKAPLPPGTTAIFSHSEPVDEESQVEFEKIVNWLCFMGIPSYRIHSSGHVYPSQLRAIVRRIKPKELLVIHSEHPEAMRKFLIS